MSKKYQNPVQATTKTVTPKSHSYNIFVNKNTGFLETNIGNPITQHKTQIRMPKKLLSNVNPEFQTGMAPASF